MNFRLFILLIFIETICLIAGVFALILFFFMYFGSGASSSSEKAILTENIVFTVLFLMPLLYGIFKSRYIEDKQKTRSYLFAGLLVTIVSGVYFIFNM